MGDGKKSCTRLKDSRQTVFQIRDKRETNGKFNCSSRGFPSQLFVGMQLLSQQRAQTLQYNCIPMLLSLSAVISVNLSNEFRFWIFHIQLPFSLITLLFEQINICIVPWYFILCCVYVRWNKYNLKKKKIMKYQQLL